MIEQLCDELWNEGFSLESWYAFHDGLRIARANAGRNVSMLGLIADVDNYRKKGHNKHNTGNHEGQKGGTKRRKSRGVPPLDPEQLQLILEQMPARLSGRDSLLRGQTGLKVIAAVNLDPPERAIYHAKQLAKCYRKRSPGVYFLQAKHDPSIWKIGKAVNLENRMKGYGSLLVAFEKPIFVNGLVEADVHEVLKHCRVDGPGCEAFCLGTKELNLLEERFGLCLRH